MSIAQGFTQSFLDEMVKGVHDLSTDTLKIALYTSSATLNSTTTAYSTTNEVSDPLGYTAGGEDLSGVSISVTTQTPNRILYIDWNDVTWDTGSVNLTFSTRGALVYNSSAANRSIFVIDFGVDYDATGSPTFTVSMPPGTPEEALMRILA